MGSLVVGTFDAIRDCAPQHVYRIRPRVPAGQAGNVQRSISDLCLAMVPQRPGKTGVQSLQITYV